jgi:hypothetical protein
LRKFFRYRHNTKILNAILKDLCWSINESKNNPKFYSPKELELVAPNALYNAVVNTKNCKVSREELEFAL